MKFNTDTFIVQINGDTTLRLRDSDNNIVFYIKVPDCTVAVSENDVLVKQQSESNTMFLNFDNRRSAIEAQRLLREALILLKVNQEKVTTVTRYLHIQSTPASVWHIHHGLGEEYNHVTIYDDNEYIIIGQVLKTSHNSIMIQFNVNITGKALIS